MAPFICHRNIWPLPEFLSKMSALPSPLKSFFVGEVAAVTVTVIVSQSLATPSLTHTSKVCGPTWPPVGVQVNAPPLVIDAPAGTVPEGPSRGRT